MDVSSDEKWWAVEELAKLDLPGYPRSVRRFHDRAIKEGWESRTVPSRGRLGARREYRPPPDVAKYIQLILLVRSFDDFRATVAHGRPLTTAKMMFINTYNEHGGGRASYVEGVEKVSLELLDEALREARERRGSSAPIEQPSSYVARNKLDVPSSIEAATLSPSPDLLVKAFYALMDLPEISGGMDQQQRSELTSFLFRLLFLTCGNDEDKLKRIVDNPSSLAAAIKFAWELYRADSSKEP